MPPVVIVETGAIVANANSFVAAADVQQFADDRGLTWSGTTDALAQAVIKAGDYLRDEHLFPWRGLRKSRLQTMPWPRVGAVERRSEDEFTDSEIPWRLKEAQKWLAVATLGGTVLQPTLARGGQIQTKKIDVISTTWFAGAPAEDQYMAVRGFLAPLLRVSAIEDAMPYFTAPDTPEELSPFAEGEFDNPST